MPGKVRIVAFAVALLAVLSGAGFAQTSSFESLIEGVLKQHPTLPPEEQPPQQPPPPQPTEPAPEAPVFPGAPAPVAPAPTTEPPIVPVEPGPRPYTPPKIVREPGENPPSPAPGPAPAASAPASNGTATPPAGAAAPAPGAAAPAPAASTPAPGAAEAVTPSADVNSAPGAAVPGAERTRESLTVEEVNAAALPAELPAQKGASPLVLKAQVLLDRAGASPGVIDAYSGGNFGKAVSAVETVLGLPIDGVLDQAVWDALGGDAAPAVLVQYTITPEDLAYPFLASIPADYVEQSRLPNLGYTSPEEMFGERFHMDTKLLTALNPTANFRQAGTQIWVTAVNGAPITDKVARIVADKTMRQVRAYDAANHLIVAYPATIGSEENPSPTGDHLVAAVTPNPVLHYDPQNVAAGGSTEKLELPPGPNNPIGTVWIDLTEPNYGIHGTADPSKIDKSAVHGCVQLTNWDAEELAGLVQPGVIVSFQ